MARISDSSANPLLLDADDAGSMHSAASTASQDRNSRRRQTRGHQSGIVHRRSHSKSRTGCRTCKRRRIKCDESKPSCRNCEKHAVTCDFIGSIPTSPHQQLLSPSQPDRSTALSGDINVLDLELMHNFTTFTCTTMASDPAVRQLLRTTAIHMAIDCEYLMRSILAVSALHLSRYRPQKKALYIQRAMHHHQVASAAAIELLTDLKQDECERLHLFAMLTIYYALGCPINEADLAPGSPLIPHWLRLLHGMEPILHMLNPKDYRGVLTPLFDFGRSRMQMFLTKTSLPDPSLLADIESLIHRTCANPDLIPVYDDVLEQLRRMLSLILTPCHTEAPRVAPEPHTMPAAAVAPPPSWIKLEAWDILIWQWTRGKHFLPLLDAASPPQEALVIFAYCVLVLKKLESQWYAEGWADHLMGKTWALLDEEYRHWAIWAIEEMGWIPPG